MPRRLPSTRFIGANVLPGLNARVLAGPSRARNHKAPGRSEGICGCKCSEFKSALVVGQEEVIYGSPDGTEADISRYGDLR